MEKRRVQVGDKLFAVFARDYKKPVRVTKVGRKYFSIEGDEHLRFSISDWEPHYDNQRIVTLYESAEEYDAEHKDGRKRAILTSAFRKFFDVFGAGWKQVSIDQLEEAAKILGIEVNYDSKD